MDTSVETDGGVKVPLYARVPHRGERLSPLAFPDLTLTVDELLG